MKLRGEWMHMLRDLPVQEAEQMAADFSALAQYNSEVARGLVHTEEWRARMAVVQAEFERRRSM